MGRKLLKKLASSPLPVMFSKGVLVGVDNLLLDIKILAMSKLKAITDGKFNVT